MRFQPILHRSDGVTILGHPRGLTYFNDGVVKTVKLGASANCRVLDLAEDASNNLWVAAFREGVFKIDSDGKKTQYPIQPDWGGQVNCVLVDHDNQVMIATNGGVFRLNDGRFVMQALKDEMNGILRKLFLDDEAEMVGVGKFGLYKKEGDGWNLSCTSSDKLIRNAYAYLDPSIGPPMIGTIGGLCCIRGNEITKLNTPRIDRPVYFIVEDQQRCIWFGTDNGVLRWDGEQLRQFTVEHGLAGRETNRAAGKVDKRGRLWIGAVGGLSINRPEFIPEINLAPSLELLRADAGDVSWIPSEQQSMPFDRDSLTFHLSGHFLLERREVKGPK